MSFARASTFDVFDATPKTMKPAMIENTMLSNNGPKSPLAAAS